LEADVVINDTIWSIVILYVCLTWALGVYLKQMNVTLLYAWSINWENRGGVVNLQAAPKPRLLEELTGT